MTHWLSEQFRRALAGGDRRDDSADLRAREAAGLGEALHPPGAASAGPERIKDFDDPAHVAAYLDGRLSGPEREEFLRALSTNPGRSADLISAAALIADLDTRREKVPAELMTRARAAFGNQPNRGWNRLRVLLDRGPSAGFALAALVLLICLPVGLLLIDGRVDWPFGLDGPSRSLNAPAPPNLDALTPGLPAAAPEPVLQFDLKSEVGGGRDSVSVRSERGSCETAISEAPNADRAAVRAEKTTRSALQRGPCSRPDLKALDTRRETPSPPAAFAPASPAPAPSSVLPTR
jgi:hypothetical protein